MRAGMRNERQEKKITERKKASALDLRSILPNYSVSERYFTKVSAHVEAIGVVDDVTAVVLVCQVVK